MIVFELTMPHRGSWNNKWSGENNKYIRTRRKGQCPQDVINKDFYFNWPDGWGACVSVREMDSKEARKLEKKSAGFCGYDWMIYSIIEYGEIRKPSEF